MSDTMLKTAGLIQENIFLNCSWKSEPGNNFWHPVKDAGRDGGGGNAAAETPRKVSICIFYAEIMHGLHGYIVWIKNQKSENMERIF